MLGSLDRSGRDLVCCERSTTVLVTVVQNNSGAAVFCNNFLIPSAVSVKIMKVWNIMTANSVAQDQSHILQYLTGPAQFGYLIYITDIASRCWHSIKPKMEWIGMELIRLSSFHRMIALSFHCHDCLSFITAAWDNTLSLLQGRICSCRENRLFSVRGASRTIE